ncbi:MAG: cation acetate symporter, partial [Chromatiaceae bacterium]
AAALSTAAGLLLAISSSISHDLLKSVFMPQISEKNELMAGRFAMAGAILVAGYFGLNPPGFAAEVVALAFGLAASSIFPALMLGIFYKRSTSQGVIWGMISGIVFTLGYIFWYQGFLFIPTLNVMDNTREYWMFGISTQAIGAIGAVINFAVNIIVSQLTEPPPEHIQHLVEDIRVPRGAGEATGH